MENVQQPLAPDEPAKRVTALIVSYNNVTGLIRLIRSIENSQDRESTEVLVIDLGSTDGSGQVDQQFPDVTVLRLAKHFGATKALNIATRTAAADYVFYLDPSVELPPNAIHELAAVLDASSEVIAAAPRLVNAEHVYKLPGIAELDRACMTGALTAVNIPESGEPVNVEYATRDALMVRKAFVQGMNFFDARYGHSWGDLELAMQIHKANRRTVVLPDLPVVWHEPENSVDDSTPMAADRWLGAAAFIEKHQGFGPSMKFRIGAMIKAFFGFQFGLFAALLSAQKVDGNQKPF